MSRLLKIAGLISFVGILLSSLVWLKTEPFDNVVVVTTTPPVSFERKLASLPWWATMLIVIGVIVVLLMIAPLFARM
jgi:hypothetical protein